MLRSLVCWVFVLVFVSPALAAQDPCEDKEGYVGAWRYWSSTENYGLMPTSGNRVYAQDYRVMEKGGGEEPRIDPPRIYSEESLYVHYDVGFFEDRSKAGRENRKVRKERMKNITLVRLEVDGRQVASATKRLGILRLPTLELSEEARQELRRGRNATFYLQTDITNWKYKHEFSLEGYSKALSLAEQQHHELVKKCR